MEITWLGHACFRLRSDETVVITDPFPATLGLRLGNQTATIVTLSNSHPNHSNWQELGGEPKLFKAPGEYEFKGVSVRGVMTPISQGTPRERRNVAYSIEMENVSVCHLGDIDVPLTPSQIDELSPVDVLLIPTGGGCTLDLERAAQMLQDFDPKIVIPMHYRIPGISLQLAEVDTFLQLLGGSEVQSQPRLSVTAANLPANMRVTVLNPQARSA
ncbi:MAG TPA: MBL fold metallo-hydrolase [Dehalococcoidia bacterium]|nr:MBL fold metallo-hydrolase [Dehalococcoidia bacterium]